MSSLLEIMDKKSCGKWYAYEQSAFYLSRMMLELSLDRYVMENWQTVPTRIRKTVRSSWSREIPRAVPQNPREAVQRRRSCLCVEKS